MDVIGITMFAAERGDIEMLNGQGNRDVHGI